MCHAVPTAASARWCNGILPHRGAAWQEGRLLLLSGGGVINYPLHNSVVHWHLIYSVATPAGVNLIL